MAVEFRDGYISRIQQEGMSRVDALRSQPIVSLYMNRTDLTTNKKSKLVSAISELGGQELTLGDIIDEGPKRTALIDTLINTGETSNVKALIGDLGKNLFAEAGITAQGTANPLRAMMRGQVGGAEYEKKGFGTDTARLRPLNIPKEVYQGTKDIAASLMASPDTRLAGGRMILMMLGGYRPSDFKALRIENIDFETGLVTGLELKTDKGKVSGIGAAYFPRPQLDVIRSIIGDRKEGLLFENPAALDKLINDQLKSADMPEILYRQESTGKNITQPVTAYDFRRMQETTLQAAGYKSDDPIRKYLTWRPLSKKEASEGYMALINQSAAIEEANALSFEPYIHLTDGNVAEMADGSVMKTHGQFLTEVGVKNLSPFTLRYAASKKGRSTLPIAEMERLDLEDTGVTYSDTPIASKPVVTDPDAASKYIEIAKTNQETRKVQADINLQKKKQERASMPPVASEPKVEQTDLIESTEDLSDDSRKALGSGFDMNKFLGKTAKAVGVGAVLETARQFIEEPVATAAELGKEVLLERGLGAGPGAAVSMIMQSTDLASGELTDEERGYPVEAMRDTGFVDIDRGPEAASANQDQGFLSR